MIDEFARQVRFGLAAFVAAIALQCAAFLGVTGWIYAPGQFVLSLFPPEYGTSYLTISKQAFFVALAANIVFWSVVFFLVITIIDARRRRSL